MGTVNTGGSNKITWDKEKGLTPPQAEDFRKQFEGKKLSKGVFSGSALVTKNKAIFLLTARTDNKKTVFGFFYLEDVDTADNMKFLPFDGISQGCYPQFFLWETKIIMVPTHCTEKVSEKVVKEIADVSNKNWVNSLGPFSHLVGFFQDKSDFTTVNIQKKTNNNDVLLFTQKKKKQPPDNNDDNNVYLWATDGNHSYRAKEILTDVNVTSINFLYTNNELLALYQQWVQTEPKDIFLKRLKTQLDDITTVINAWKSNDGIVKQLCNDKILCEGELPTDKLVGFLSDNSEDNNKIWKDEYYYVNAILKEKNTYNKPAKVTGGFAFSGDGVGAQWPVGKEEKDQPYNFTDPGFTLLATVEIGKNNNEKTFDNSLLGLSLKEDNNKRIGLLCSGGNWAVGDKTQIFKKSEENKCEQEETYFVGLVLNKNKNLAIYVDGSKLTDSDDQKLKIEEGKNIAQFYFGADAEGAEGTQKLAKTDVTITNVLLYNRQIDEEEIKNIKAKKREKLKIPPPTLNGNIDTQEDGKNTGENDRTSSTSATPTTTEKDGAEIKLCSPLKNDFTVFALLLLVGFTLLARYA